MRMRPGYPQGEERSFDLPIDGDSIRVVIRQPLEREKRILFRKLNAKEETDVDGETVQAWVLEAVQKFLVGVTGYARAGTTGPVAITSADDLMRYGETGVVEQIAAEILAGMPDAQKKTSVPSSAGGSAETQASTGTAASAELPAYAPSAAVTGQPLPHLLSSSVQGAA